MGHVCIKTINLPRQARDKYRWESLKGMNCFCRRQGARLLDKIQKKDQVEKVYIARVQRCCHSQQHCQRTRPAAPPEGTNAAAATAAPVVGVTSAAVGTEEKEVVDIGDEFPAGPFLVRKRSSNHFPLMYKNDYIYQDRLGTNIGTALQKERPCSRRCRPQLAGAHRKCIFCGHFILKTEYLPRQARDNHRKS